MDARQGREQPVVCSGTGAEKHPAIDRTGSTSSPASGNGAAVQAAAPWSSLHGAKRIQAELKQLHADLPSCYPFVRNLKVVGDNMHLWHLELCNFDDSTEGGRQLNDDLRKLQRLHGQDHLLLELEFPVDYPTSPFFARLVKPRCIMYTGHVTAGGSICLEALTNSGSSGSWQPSFSVGSMINVIVNNMLECPMVYIETATGPGGLTGPLRVEFNLGNPTYGYSSTEAKAAFDRTLKNHKRMGWGSPGKIQPGNNSTASTSSGTAPSTTAAAAPAAMVGGSSIAPVAVPGLAPTIGVAALPAGGLAAQGLHAPVDSGIPLDASLQLIPTTSDTGNNRAPAAVGVPAPGGTSAPDKASAPFSTSTPFRASSAFGAATPSGAAAPFSAAAAFGAAAPFAAAAPFGASATFGAAAPSGPAAPFSTSTPFGASAAFGASTPSGASALFGASTAFGVAASSGASVLFGASALYGASAPLGAPAPSGATATFEAPARETESSGLEAFGGRHSCGFVALAGSSSSSGIGAVAASANHEGAGLFGSAPAVGSSGSNAAANAAAGIDSAPLSKTSAASESTAINTGGIATFPASLLSGPSRFSQPSPAVDLCDATPTPTGTAFTSTAGATSSPSSSRSKASFTTDALGSNAPQMKNTAVSFSVCDVPDTDEEGDSPPRDVHLPATAGNGTAGNSSDSLMPSGITVNRALSPAPPVSDPSIAPNFSIANATVAAGSFSCGVPTNAAVDSTRSGGSAGSCSLGTPVGTFNNSTTRNGGAGSFSFGYSQGTAGGSSGGSAGSFSFGYPQGTAGGSGAGSAGSFSFGKPSSTAGGSGGGSAGSFSFGHPLGTAGGSSGGSAARFSFGNPQGTAAGSSGGSAGSFSFGYPRGTAAGNGGGGAGSFSFGNPQGTASGSGGGSAGSFSSDNPQGTAGGSGDGSAGSYSFGNPQGTAAGNDGGSAGSFSIGNPQGIAAGSGGGSAGSFSFDNPQGTAGSSGGGSAGSCSFGVASGTANRVSFDSPRGTAGSTGSAGSFNFGAPLGTSVQQQQQFTSSGRAGSAGFGVPSSNPSSNTFGSSSIAGSGGFGVPFSKFIGNTFGCGNFFTTSISSAGNGGFGAPASNLSSNTFGSSGSAGSVGFGALPSNTSSDTFESSGSAGSVGFGAPPSNPSSNTSGSSNSAGSVGCGAPPSNPSGNTFGSSSSAGSGGFGAHPSNSSSNTFGSSSSAGSDGFVVPPFDISGGSPTKPMFSSGATATKASPIVSGSSLFGSQHWPSGGSSSATVQPGANSFGPSGSAAPPGSSRVLPAGSLPTFSIPQCGSPALGAAAANHSVTPYVAIPVDQYNQLAMACQQTLSLQGSPVRGPVVPILLAPGLSPMMMCPSSPSLAQGTYIYTGVGCPVSPGSCMPGPSQPPPVPSGAAAFASGNAAMGGASAGGAWGQTTCTQQQVLGSQAVSYLPTWVRETSSSDSTVVTYVTFRSITAMAAYLGKSTEELRCEDYQAGRRRSTAAPVAAAQPCPGTSTTLLTNAGNPPYCTTWAVDDLSSSGVYCVELQTITAMPAYKNASTEELRLQDYQAGRNSSAVAQLQPPPAAAQPSCVRADAEVPSVITATPTYQHLSTEEVRFRNYGLGIKRSFGAAAPLQQPAAEAAPAAAVTAAPSSSAPALSTAVVNVAVPIGATASDGSGGSSTPHSTTLEIKYPPTWQRTSNSGLLLKEVCLPGNAAPLSPWRLQQQLRSACLWQPSNTRQMSALEAAAVQQQLKTMDVNMLQGQLQLGLPDALAALLLAEGDMEGAHAQVACCADSGGPAKIWTQIYGHLQGAPVVGSSSTAAAADGSSSSQQGPASAASDAQEVEALLQKLDSTGVQRSKVLKVVRVQNPMLWVRYYVRQREMQDQLGAAGINEQQLFHGTSATAAAAITQEGFDGRLNCASVYGQGTYFSGSSCGALCYSRTKELGNGSGTAGSSNGTLTLLLARVLLGRQCEGKYGIKRPPDGYDSVHSNMPVGSSGDSRYHVVFDNSSAYPEYVITVRQ